jgi:ribosomal protein S18 acetylase RimI-like enzyme
LLRIASVRFTDPAAQALVAQVQEEYVVRYGGPDDTPLDPHVFDPPDGAFFVGYLGDVPVAMGGWRLRPDLHELGGERLAEIKRMYVAPAGRRTGLGRRTLAHLERTAAASGVDVMVLETGMEQPEAISLYESSGYVPVGRFGHYAWSPKSRYYGKPL